MLTVKCKIALAIAVVRWIGAPARAQIDDLMTFFAALEDGSSANRSDLLPNWVPSGLPLQFNSAVADADDLTDAIDIILNRIAARDELASPENQEKPEQTQALEIVRRSVNVLVSRK